MIFFNISKKIYRVGLLALVALLLASCSWFSDDAIQPQPIPVIPQFNTFTITGKLTTNGAMPENYAQVMNSRTALATAPTGQTISHKVLVLANQGDDTKIDGTTSHIDLDANGDMVYTIKYVGTDTTARQYWLRAIAYYLGPTGDVIVLASPDTQLDTAVDLKGGVFTKDLEMRPVTSGYGEVALTITLEDASMCDTVSIDDDTHFNITKSGTTVTITHKPYSAEQSKMASGSYPVTVSFYKTVSGLSSPLLVYQFEDIINVFNNLKTNTWVDNGGSPHLTTESGVTSCSITSAKLTDFNKTNIYVEKSYDGDFLGTYQQPYQTLKDAITLIEQTGSSNTIYTIHVKEVASSDNFDEEITSTIQINKKIKIDVYKQTSAPGSNDGYYLLKSTSTSTPAFKINSGGLLVFESNGAALERSGFPAQGTKGIVITEAYQGVYVSGKFVMKGGLITGCTDQGVYLSTSGSEKTFEMYGGAITANSGKGLRVSTGTSFVIKGKPYIYGNTIYNLRLNNGCVMTVAGRLQEGALIGIVTETPPTIPQPVPITSGYGYQTGGYNAGVLPGAYFRGDVYGVTEDGDPDSGEAVLALSGGTITTAPFCDENLQITINKNFFTTDELKNDQVLSFAASTIQEGTRVEIPAEDITYTSTLCQSGDELSTSYYTSLDAGGKFRGSNKAFGPGVYEVCVHAIYKGNTYYADFNVKVYDVTVPDGYKIVPGASFTSSTTLCNSDSNRKSRVFLGGRNLTIPDLIVCDHEVTQGEYDDYMTWYAIAKSGSFKPASAYGLGDNYPAYYVCRYEALMYCNLKSKADKLTPAYYLADSSGNEVPNGRDVKTWMEMAYSKIGQYETDDNKKVFFYNDSTYDTNSLLDWTGSTDTNGGIRYDESADGWRLPVIAEWEYIAREGNLTDEGQYIYSGSDNLEEIAVVNASSSSEVKSKIPNALGIYDMTGNVFEYCWDWHNTISTTTPLTGPETYSGSSAYCVVVGASYTNSLNPGWYKISGYTSDSLMNRINDQGFRIVRTVK